MGSVNCKILETLIKHILRCRILVYLLKHFFVPLGFILLCLMTTAIILEPWRWTKYRVAEGIKRFGDLPLLFSHPKTLAAGIYN